MNEAPQTPETVLLFWFGELDANGCADAVHAQRWWKRDAEFDKSIRERFLETHAAVTRQECESWLTHERSRLAYIIVLDQFSRNMFRNTEQMFASDGRALQVTLEGHKLSMDEALHLDERCFYYMPLMHSEDMAMQNKCVKLFGDLAQSVEGRLRDRVNNNLKFAIAHRDIIERFGRFPHRNALLGRSSTVQELEFLKQPGSSF